jgi:O-antigen/teichoic acid export membrane protein
VSLRQIAPEAALIGAGQAVAALASIATIRVLTGILRPAAFGRFGLALTVATLAQQCLLGPIAMAAVRYYAPSWDSGNICGYVRGIGALCVIGTLALAVLTAAASRWIPNLWAAGVYAWVSSASSLLDGVQNAARQRALVALHQGAGGWLRLALLIVGAKIWGASSEGTLWAYSAGYTVLIASQSFFLWRTLARGRSAAAAISAEPLAFSMAHYAWPFSAWGVFTWMQASADRWALSAYSGLYQTGLYQSLYQLGYYPASLVTQFLVQVATPILFAKAGRGGDAERWNHRLMLAAIAATIAGAAVSAAGGHKILALLLAPDYRGQSALVTPLILASGCFAAGQIGAIHSMMAMKPRRLIAPKIVTAIGGAAFIAAGAAAAGTKGVVAAQLAFSLAYLVWIVLLNRRHAALSWRSSPDVAPA